MARLKLEKEAEEGKGRRGERAGTSQVSDKYV